MWTPELEVNLFHALRGHKPTGVNRFFHMACIHHKLVLNSDVKDITSKDVWDHLHELYNLETLNELDELPFNNASRDFMLPEEITNPELMMSAPSSPALSSASVDDSSTPSRPTNLNLANIKNNPLLSTPDSLQSPKRKRNARQAQLSGNSQPSSPVTPNTSKRRR